MLFAALRPRSLSLGAFVFGLSVLTSARAHAEGGSAGTPPASGEMTNGEYLRAGRVHTVFDSNDPDATLEQQGGPGVLGPVKYLAPGLVVQFREPGYRVVCDGPCEALLDRQGTYRINGSGVRESAPFQLPATQGTLHLQVHASAPVLVTLGRVLGVAGALGATLTVVGGVGAATGGASSNQGHGSDAAEIGLAVGSAVALTAGLVIFLSTKTHVTTDGGLVLAKGAATLSLDGLRF